jgi:hypothetical protein
LVSCVHMECHALEHNRWFLLFSPDNPNTPLGPHPR